MFMNFLDFSHTLFRILNIQNALRVMVLSLIRTLTLIKCKQTLCMFPRMVQKKISLISFIRMQYVIMAALKYSEFWIANTIGQMNWFFLIGGNHVLFFCSVSFIYRSLHCQQWNRSSIEKKNGMKGAIKV